MTVLFDAAKLGSWLGYSTGDVDDDQCAAVLEVVEGWILGATGWNDIPAEPAKPLRAWALELGGIAYENPTSQTDDQTDLVRSSWRDRRSQILAEIRTWSQSNGSAVGGQLSPRGSFPPARPYPDPADRRYPFGLRP
ncbi:hypothetical protein G7075_00010 [Phycicoccus sp. HDW14]|uniref:hypothetical protein n=1 Tax=Phycicoccus sp. HDW14 TaxID=2714941 RepID=UPI00140841E4|nr:hypothetical protein [Phycicoccus sp. HDW14]QIM19880.1 hypothetical protein G7075_00010 [Phycicoccus sp. HDW14]